eukprot:7027338-Pyramimonas_sp.AAC.1
MTSQSDEGGGGGGLHGLPQGGGPGGERLPAQACRVHPEGVRGDRLLQRRQLAAARFAPIERKFHPTGSLPHGDQPPAARPEGARQQHR